MTRREKVRDYVLAFLISLLIGLLMISPIIIWSLGAFGSP